jgi:hypothetical protein
VAHARLAASTTVAPPPVPGVTTRLRA